MKLKYHFQCNDCKTEYPGEGILYLCTSCREKNIPGQPAKGVLKTIYDYRAIGAGIPVSMLFDKLEMECFLPLLPLKSMDCWPKLKVGNTPLYRFDDVLDGKPGIEIYLKDDSQNPTFSFKDRASALVSAWAKENGINTIIAASTGNAGSSLAGICASQGQHSVIFVPSTAPLAKLTQIVMYGATIVPVKGNYDTAFALSIRATEKFGCYNRNTAFNPLTIEGKKTVSFELYSQMNHELPGRIFVPVGDSVILAGVYKGFEDLLNLGIIDRMPVLVAVQAEGSRNLVNNIGGETFVSQPSKTIADSISVDVPGNFYMSVDYLKQYKGEWITVTDEEILQASVRLSGKTGIFTEPAAAAAFAGLIKYNTQKRLEPGSKNVVLLTGSGLKDLKSVQPAITLPDAVEPGDEALDLVFGTLS